MKNLNMETAIKRYNKIMNMCGYEHKTIGEPLSEDTENYTLTDMLNEVKYILGTFYEPGHCNYEMKNEYDDDCRKEYYRELGIIKRFVETYNKFV